MRSICDIQTPLLDLTTSHENINIGAVISLI